MDDNKLDEELHIYIIMYLENIKRTDNLMRCVKMCDVVGTDNRCHRWRYLEYGTSSQIVTWRGRVCCGQRGGGRRVGSGWLTQEGRIE